MVNYCVAFGCNNSYKDGVSLFKFPKDPNLREAWVKQVKRTRDKWTGPSQHSVLCCNHFTEDSFEPSPATMGIKKRVVLKAGAIPTIFKRPTTTPVAVPKKRTAHEKLTRSRMVASMMHNESDDPVSTNQLSSRSDIDPLATVATASVVSTCTPEQQTTSTGATTSTLDIASEFETCTPLPTCSTKSVEIQTDCVAPCKRSVRVQAKPFTKEKGAQTATESNDFGVQCCMPSIASKPRRDIAIQCCMTSTTTHDIGTQCDLHAITDSITEASNTDISTASSDEKEGSLYSPSEDEVMNSKSNNVETQNLSYIVFESSLLSLFGNCPICNAETSVTKYISGTYLKIHQICNDKNCSYKRVWESQPRINGTPLGNIMLSGAIAFSGALPTLALRVFQSMKCATITSRTYFRHQAKFLEPAITSVWLKHQQNLLAKLKDENEPLIIGGDGRADSPGHSAKFGSYTVMDLKHRNVIDLQLVQSNEVKNSNNMEKEGLVRAVKHLKDNELEIGTLVTDRHLQIAKWARENIPETDHRYDVWHVSKSFRKKVEKLSKKKGCEIAGEWLKSLVNHLYWCASSTEDGDGEMILAKWLSVVNHIHNKHRNHGKIFPKCMHSRLYKRKWIKPHTEVSEKLTAIIEDAKLCNAIRQLSPRYQTSSLEAFHSVVIHFAPKHTAFSFQGMLARLYIAALHYNENNQRDQATTMSGSERYSILYPKYKKGEPIVRKILVACTYGYIEQLFQEVFEFVSASIEPPSLLLPPPPLTSNYSKVDKDTTVAQHNSRFIN